MDFNEKSIRKTIKEGTCLNCGVCYFACKFNAIKCNADNNPEVLNEKCTQCGMCQKVCVGKEFDFLKSYKEIHKASFKVDDPLGHYKEAFLSYASNDKERENGSSGGFIRAFLISLLDEGKIKGALVVGSDEKEIWKAKGTFVTTKEEIINLEKSHYEKSFLLSSLKDVEKIDGKIAVVVLPCQAQALYKLKETFPFLNEKILITIGLFCHSQIEVFPQRYAFSLLKEKKENIKKYITRYEKHPGTPCVVLNNNAIEPLYFNNLFKLVKKLFPKRKIFIPSSHDLLNLFYLCFTPKRCKFCFDGASLFADISVGDPWIKGKKDIDFKKGYSFVVVRTNVAKELIKVARDKGNIKIENLKEDEINACNKGMLTHKIKQAIYFLKKENKVDYKDFCDSDFKLSLKERISFCFSRQMFYICQNKIIRKLFLKFIFSIFGYFLIYLNSKRRSFNK